MTNDPCSRIPGNKPPSSSILVPFSPCPSSMIEAYIYIYHHNDILNQHMSEMCRKVTACSCQWLPTNMKHHFQHHFQLSSQQREMGMDQYLSIPFLVGWTSINPSYFDVNYRGTGFWPIPKWFLESVQNSGTSLQGLWCPEPTLEEEPAYGRNPEGVTGRVFRREWHLKGWAGTG